MTAPGAGTDRRDIELLGIEPLEKHARRLAAQLTVAVRRRGGNHAHLKRLRDDEDTLRRVYAALAEDVTRGERSSPAAEWLLDNFHVVVAALRDIRHDLRPIRPSPSAGRRRRVHGAPARVRHGTGADSLQRGTARRAAPAPVRHRVPVEP